MALIFKRNNRVEEDQEGLSRSFSNIVCVHNNRDQVHGAIIEINPITYISFGIISFVRVLSLSSVVAPPTTFHRRCLSCVLLFLFMLKTKNLEIVFDMRATPKHSIKSHKNLFNNGSGQALSTHSGEEKKVRNHFSDCRLRAVQPFDVSSRFLISMQFDVFFSSFLSLLSFCRAHIDDSAALCSAISYISAYLLLEKLNAFQHEFFVISSDNFSAEAENYCVSGGGLATRTRRNFQWKFFHSADECEFVWTLGRICISRSKSQFEQD